MSRTIITHGCTQMMVLLDADLRRRGAALLRAGAHHRHLLRHLLLGAGGEPAGDVAGRRPRASSSCRQKKAREQGRATKAPSCKRLREMGSDPVTSGSGPGWSSRRSRCASPARSSAGSAPAASISLRLQRLRVARHQHPVALRAAISSSSPVVDHQPPRARRSRAPGAPPPAPARGSGWRRGRRRCRPASRAAGRAPAPRCVIRCTGIASLENASTASTSKCCGGSRSSDEARIAQRQLDLRLAVAR